MPSACRCDGAHALWVLGPDLALGGVGKWMLFPPAAAVDAVWAAVCDATTACRLGFAAKCSLRDPAKPAIMVYTPDGDDMADVDRVRVALAAVVRAQRLPPAVLGGYKSDAATAAGLYASRVGPAAAHADAAGGSARSGPVTTLSSERCRHFRPGVMGSCSRGDACRYVHDRD